MQGNLIHTLLFNLNLYIMKKLLLVLALVMAGFLTYAQDCTVKTKVPGTNETVKVDYYKDGKMVLTNYSKVTVASLHVKVTVEQTAKAGSAEKAQNKQAVVLYDKTIKNLKPETPMNLTVKDGVKASDKGTFKIVVTDMVQAATAAPAQR